MPYIKRAGRIGLWPWIGETGKPGTLSLWQEQVEPDEARGGAMGRLIKLLLALAVIALLGLTIYAYYPGTLAPEQAEVVKPVTLNVDQ